ncbi:MAG: hypothetical protein LC721_02820 [Actinobacteria bacterium]|nr:hypothetical protein [Actinomycetota bacterium]
MVALLEAFLDQALTPAAFYQFEGALQTLWQHCGRAVVEWAINQLEPEPLPAQVCRDRESYRLRPKSPRRRVDSLFGPVRLWRYRYEARTLGEPSWFPLEEHLGIEAGRATPALAERAAWWSVGQTQAQVLAILRRDHGVCWSVQTLRQVTQSLSSGMAEQRQAAQVAKLKDWLHQAAAAGGPHRPVLSVGRDGVMMPLRHETEYREAATGTVSVIDGRGHRLGTVYLGRLPEQGQKTLSRQMTSLLTGLLAVLAGVLPRLHYVSDGGHEPTRYFQQVLRKLVDPFRPGRVLRWTRVIDFYHACSYITKMREALCGLVPVISWARKMRHWLRDKRNGVFRVLHSAAALRARSRRRWTQAEKKAYQDGYRYLRKRKAFMDYACYRRQGLPIGSGITEAACKTVFTQRLKQSGMTWDIAGGQVIVELRTIWLSDVWAAVHGAYLANKPLPQTGTHTGKSSKIVQKAA